EEGIVIVGGGVAGLATALGLHRLGIRSLVLESSDKLRITGFAFMMWRNAWKALEALGIAPAIREKHNSIQGYYFHFFLKKTIIMIYIYFVFIAAADYELRGVNRKVLLETIENELPKGTIRFSSKVVTIQNDGEYKSLLLADGTSIKAKVLIGSDGVYSPVAKFLGFKKAVQTGRYAARGLVNFEEGHGLGCKAFQLLGIGARHGIVPLDDRQVFWFFTYNPTSQGMEIDLEHDNAKLKAFILGNLGNTPEKQRRVFADTDVHNISCTELRYRHPWDLICANISKHNVCVIGDALHPMTPDIGQGACAALEDSVVLARCLGRAVDKYDVGLEKFAKERRWRSIKVISLAYVSGFVNQGQGAVLSFLRDKFLAGVVMRAAFKLSMYDCGKL
ncbi:hypothetical protein M569_01468, partial [Genlisea aurea]